jgi:DNA-binding transcriptional ArsR family regulator
MDMKSSGAVTALAALAHQHRLALYRLLVQRGPAGLSAGKIGERLRLLPSSLTFHLQTLHRAGLLTQQRQGRQLIYCADFAAMRDLVGFLTESCCAESAACEPARCTPGTGSKRSARAA